MLFLITVPANNTRGPRYMEKSLAAMHQARLRHPVTLIYGSTDEQVGLFMRCHAADRDTVLEPIVANYPQATVAPVEEGSVAVEGSPSRCEVWHSDFQLVLELFPILRHAQFEDALNHNCADPVSGLLRAILPEADLECRIEITIRPASRHRCHQARHFKLCSPRLVLLVTRAACDRCFALTVRTWVMGYASRPASVPESMRSDRCNP